MRAYGIIGNPLGHSQSPEYYRRLAMRDGIALDYGSYELQAIEEVVPLLTRLAGFTVTAPYKQAIIPYLSVLDKTAEEIGAVNVVHYGKGYNTDWIGFSESIRPYLRKTDQHALLLGTGGAAKAAAYGLSQLGIDSKMVSRSNGKGDLRYDELTDEVIASHTIIVNCTPRGMHPMEQDRPAINYSAIGSAHILYDCIYNPSETLFLREGKRAGARIVNGQKMFERQADAAWAIWNN